MVRQYHPVLWLSLFAFVPLSVSAQTECSDCRQDLSLQKSAEEILTTLGAAGVTGPGGAETASNSDKKDKGKKKKKEPVSSNYLGSYESVDFLIGRVELPPGEGQARKDWLARTNPTYDGPVDGASRNSKTNDGVERRTPSALLDQFYIDKDGKLVLGAIQKDIEKARQFDRDAFIAYCMEEEKQSYSEGGRRAYGGVCGSIYDHRDGQFKDHPYAKKWAKKKISIGLKAAEEKFQAAIEAGKALSAQNLRDPKVTNSRAAQDLYAKLFEGREIYEAVRNEDADRASLRYSAGGFVKLPFHAFEVDSDRPEASNLLRPGDTTGRDFLSSAEVQELKKNGYDLSELQIPDSGLYRNPTKPISSFNVLNYDGSTEKYVGKEMNDPAYAPTLEFAELSTGGGATPKFEVESGGHKYKLKYSVPVPGAREVGSIPAQVAARFSDGSEVYTENVVNPLFAAVGFTVDPTYYHQKARLYVLPQDQQKAGVASVQSPEQVAAYNSKFEDRVRGLVQSIESAGQTHEAAAGAKPATDYSKIFRTTDASGAPLIDEQGRRYVEMDRVSLEVKTDSDTAQKLGLYHKETEGRILDRGQRCLAVGNALFSDDDSKDANGDIKIAKNADGTWKAIRSASDMGATMGSPFGGKGMPNYFGSDMVDQSKSRPGHIVTTFRTHHDKAIFDAVSTADLQWCLKRFDQLTEQQIMDAMTKRTDMPVEVATLLKDKILRRLDQLNEAAGLMGKKIKEAGTGRELLISARSGLTDVAHYAPQGLERYFKDGKLVALKDMSHPEAARWLRTNGESAAGAKTAALGMAANLAQHPLRYFGIGMGRFFGGRVEKALGVSPELKCLPTQVVVENPEKDPKAPYWVIDVFQFAIGASAGKSEILPRGNSLGGRDDVSGYYVKEVMRVHPTKDPNALKSAAKLLAVSCNPKTVSNDMSESMLSAMQPGDVILYNEYKTAGGSTKASTIAQAAPGLAAGPVGVALSSFLTAGAKIEKVSSTAIMKQEGSQLILARRDQKGWKAQGDLQLKMPLVPFIRLPIAGVAKYGETQVDQNIGIDLTELSLGDKSQRKQLLEMMASDSPEQRQLAGKVLQERTLKTRGSSSFLSFLGLGSGRDSAKESVTGQYRDHQSGVARDMMAEVRKKGWQAPLLSFGQAQESIRADLVDETSSGKSDFALKIDVQYVKQFAHRKDLNSLESNALKLFPPETLPFSPSKSNVNLGTLRFDGTIQLSRAALMKAFSPSITADVACKAFESSMPFQPSSGSWCEIARKYSSVDDARRGVLRDYQSDDTGKMLTGVLAARQFMEEYTATQKKLAALRPESGERDRGPARSALKSLANSISSAYVPQATLNALEKLSGNEGICRQAELSNSLRGFVGLDKVSFKDPGCEEVNRSLAIAHGDGGEVYSDKVFNVLKPYMFDYFSDQGLKSPVGGAPSPLSMEQPSRE